uniref:Glycoprotein n=1 Tax=Strongyloides stercoralis TaxID=6248 RepID=A0A0K0EGT1_STRER
MTTLNIILVIWALSSTILSIICLLSHFGICIDKKYFKMFKPNLFKTYSQSNDTTISSKKNNQSMESICHEITNDIHFIRTPIEIYSKRHILNIEISPNSREPSVIDPIEYYTLSRIGDSQLNNITHEDDLKIFPIIDGKHKYVPCYISQKKHEPTLYCVGHKIIQ